MRGSHPKFASPRRSKRRGLAAHLALVTALLWGGFGLRAAHAQTVLSVQRDVDAENCPDTERLVAALRELRNSPLPDAVGYQVYFRREGDALLAQIADGQGGTRDLRDADQSC